MRMRTWESNSNASLSYGNASPSKPVEESSAHARMSPSSLHRVLDCPGSLLFIESLPDSDIDRSNSLPARRGTAGHGVGEMVLRSATVKKGKVKFKSKPLDYLGQEVEGVIIDEEILSAVVPYVKYCKKLIAKAIFHGAELRFDLTHWKGLNGSIINGVDLGGTMDFVALWKRVLEIVDLKTGKGVVVEVNDNPQLLTYALLALVNYAEPADIDEIKITISQHLAYHEDGGTRHQTISKKKLLKWANKTLVPQLEFALSGEAPLIAGKEQCKFCPGRGSCKAAYELTCSEANIEFGDLVVADDGNVASEIALPNPESLEPEQRQNLLLHADTIIDFLSAVKSLEHIKAEKGEILEGFKLVRKRSNRVYKGNEKKRLKQMKVLGLTSADIYTTPTVHSPAQIETAMKAKGFSINSINRFLEEFVEKPEGGTNLVPLSKPGKPVAPAIDTEFCHLIEDDLLSL